MIIEQSYKLDNFLTSVEDRSIFDLFGVKIKNDYPKLDQIVKSYRQKLEEISKKPRYDEFKPPKSDKDIYNLISQYWNEQSYHHEINLPIGNDFYTIVWSVPKAKKVIETYNIECINFFVNIVADGLAPGSVDANQLRKDIKNEDPIIVIEYPLLNTRTRLIVIDGNHRLALKIQDKEKFIKGHLLNPEHQYKALAGEQDRIIYTVHNNLGMIIEYMTGRINKSKLNQYLLPI